jgi:hypothetical protein
VSTTAQKFYLDSAATDVTGGTTVKKLSEATPATNSTTTNTWTTTTAATETHVPLTASSTASDTSSSNEWVLNNGGTDGLGSISAAERWFKPGVWSFSMSYTLNAPALLATIACTVTARVYRVSSAGVRTILFTAASANFAATAVVTWSSTTQPEIVLGAGESLAIGYTPLSAATANAVNTITNTVLTLSLGASSFVTVPGPGVRTLSRGDFLAAGQGVESAGVSRVLGAAYTATGSGTLLETGGSIFTGRYTAVGVGAVSVLGSSVAGAAYATVGTGALAFAASKVLGSKYGMNSGALTPDWPSAGGTKTISGTVTTNGAPTSGATCRLIRDTDNFPCQVATSDAAGTYSFIRDATDPYSYHVEVYVGSTLHGLTDRGLGPA